MKFSVICQGAQLRRQMQKKVKACKERSDAASLNPGNVEGSLLKKQDQSLFSLIHKRSAVNEEKTGSSLQGAKLRSNEVAFLSFVQERSDADKCRKLWIIYPLRSNG